MNRIALLSLAAILTACLTGCAAQTKRILVLVPSQVYLRLEHGRLVRVGSYLDEVTIPALTFVAQNWQLTFASPEGNKPALDPRSNNSHYFPASGNVTYQAALAFWRSYPSLQKPLKLRDLAVEDPDAPANATTAALHGFDALFIPGGHAPMIDLWPSTAVARILLHFIDTKKVIGAVCHGPVVLASTTLLRAPWDLAGRNMTVFSKPEEQFMEKTVWKARMGFYPSDILSRAGGNVQEGAPFVPHVVVDGRLVTGQNPSSAPLFASTFVALLR